MSLQFSFKLDEGRVFSTPNWVPFGTRAVDVVVIHFKPVEMYHAKTQEVTYEPHDLVSYVKLDLMLSTRLAKSHAYIHGHR